MIIRYSALAAVTLFLASAPVNAQVPGTAGSYRTSGAQVGAYLNGTGATYAEGDEADSGPGITLRLGYGFGKRLSVFFAGTGSSMDSGDYTLGDYTLAHADFGGRYLFSEARFRPYLQAALSGRVASVELMGETLEVRGVGPTVAAGFEYGLGRATAVDVGLSFTSGKYSEARFGGGAWHDLGRDAERSSTARLDIGVIWRP